jgi:glycosyltransferase involved in cell wall biosynthesis
VSSAGCGSESPQGSARVDISVVLPVLNGGETLACQLDALASQTFEGRWELIVADNGSTDRSMSVAAAFRERIPGLVVMDASHRMGRAAACNAGASAASADTIAFCDADDVASRRWLEACFEASRNHSFIAGALDHYALNPSTPPWKRDVLSRPPRMPGWKAFADGANMVVSRLAFDAVGGYCEEMLRAADVDLSWRLEAAGYPLHFEATAVMAKRGRSTYCEIWRQSAAWGAAEFELRRRHAEHRHAPWELVPGGLMRTLRTDERLRDRDLLLALAHPRYRRSWVAAAARIWGRLRASSGTTRAGCLPAQARTTGRRRPDQRLHDGRFG